MTDRVNTLIVALEDDYRVDDIKDLMRAISLLSGVLKVEHGKPVDSNDWSIECRIRQEFGERLWDVLYPKKETK